MDKKSLLTKDDQHSLQLYADYLQGKLGKKPEEKIIDTKESDFATKLKEALKKKK
jgi:hypothetical protein